MAESEPRVRVVGEDSRISNHYSVRYGRVLIVVQQHSIVVAGSHLQDFNSARLLIAELGVNGLPWVLGGGASWALPFSMNAQCHGNALSAERAAFLMRVQ